MCSIKVWFLFFSIVPAALQWYGTVTCFSRQVLSTKDQRSKSKLALTKDVSTLFVPNNFSREKARDIIDTQLMPRKEYSERIGWGRDAQGLGGESKALNPSDPRLSMTYAEFPLESFDRLIDLGLQYLPQSPENYERLSLVDIGSGCGRLVFYSAMTRKLQDQQWDVQGIEIATLLHERAYEYVHEGVRNALFSFHSSVRPCNTLSLNLGTVEDHSSILQTAHLVFAYSTAFPAKHFSPDLGALILDPEWSCLLSQSCSVGCVAITTDRALDPAYNWELVDRLDVENPEVFGTTGYIHILRG